MIAQQNTSQFNEYEAIGFQDHLIQLNRLHLFAPDRLNSIRNNRVRFQLSLLQEKPEPFRAQIHQRIWFLDNLERSYLIASIYQNRERMLHALAVIEEEKYEQAEQIINSINEFRPGESGMGEECLQLLVHRQQQPHPSLLSHLQTR